MTNLSALNLVFVEQTFCVFDANPYPRTGIPLIAFAQENVAAAARDRSEERPLPIYFETEFADVVVDAADKFSTRKIGVTPSKLTAFDGSLSDIRILLWSTPPLLRRPLMA